VATLDIDADVFADAEGPLENAGYEQVRVLARDGPEGSARRRRSTGSSQRSDVGAAPAWREQLAEGGRLVAPLEHARAAPPRLACGARDLRQGRFVGWSAYTPIRGLLHQQLPWPDTVLGECDRGPLAEFPARDRFGTGPPIPGWGIPHDVMDFFLFLGAIGSTGGGATASSELDRRPMGGRAPGFFGIGTRRSEWAPSWRRPWPLLGSDEPSRVMAAGCPAFEDWLVTLAAHNVEGARFLVEREHYNETVTLPES
jgi:hypothetical protein